MSGDSRGASGDDWVVVREITLERVFLRWSVGGLYRGGRGASPSTSGSGGARPMRSLLTRSSRPSRAMVTVLESAPTTG